MKAVADALVTLLPYLQLPYVSPTNFTERESQFRPNPRTGYALTLRGGDQNRWCHETADGGPLYHSSPEKAEACFNTNFPGVVEAIKIIEKSKEPPVGAHVRGSLRLGHQAQVWCSCGWKSREFTGESGDHASELIEKKFNRHLRQVEAILRA